MTFIPSLVLSRALFEGQIAPLMAAAFPGLKYAAATLGMCSEILGLDDEVSMDHEWGPRIRMYLTPQDHARYAGDVMAVLRERLPPQFEGLDMMWRQPGVDIHDTREKALYHVSVGTVCGALGFCGGLAALPLQDVGWLQVSEQHLLEFTAGVVYRDDLGELTQAREQLSYYPANVLRFLLMSEWYALNGDWFPIGRIGSRGNALGLRIQAARAVQRLMRIAYMVSRRYAPYKKWFGTLFQTLPVAQALGPVLHDLLAEGDWQQVEIGIAQAAAILLEQQNELGITPPIAVQVETVDDGRHHVSGDYGGIGRQIADHVQPPLEAVIENQVFWLHERNLILWNDEVGKWALLLQKERA
jgi:hypothetical protein